MQQNDLLDFLELIDLSQFSKNFWSVFSIESLRPEFLRAAQSRNYSLAQIGRAEERHRNKEIRSDSTSWIDFTKSENENPNLGRFFNQLMNQLNMETYYGLTGYEAHFTRYEPGQAYDWHFDVLSGTSFSPRRISFVAYLHESWNEGDGGELELADGQLIQPLPGHAIVFDSEKIRHRVHKTHRTRWSLTGWFRTGAQV